MLGEEDTVLKMPAVAVAFVVAAFAAAPAQAQLKLRLGAETQVLDHVGSGASSSNNPSGTKLLTDQWRPSVVGMIGFSVLPLLSIDAELAESYRVNPSSRTGTTFRLGATLEPPIIPFYIRGAVPLHLEPSPFFASARVAVGTTFGIPVAKLYIEGAADFPIGGGTGAPSAFSQQTFSVGAGLQLSL